MAKKITRILSALLTLLLLCSVVDNPLLQNMFARAETTAGSINVPATPEDIVSLGEWKYWVEDGKAYIAGYANADVVVLTIPYDIGGYPVVGIGHGAFTANSKLKIMDIHTNVTAIAEDAFEGLEGVTITAYHGSYALEYAKGHDIINPWLKETGIGFVDGVLDLTGMNPKAYSKLKNESVTFIADEATFLKEGQLVYFPVQDACPTGLAARINQIKKVGSELHVSISQPNFEEMFTYFNGVSGLYLDWEHAEYAEGVTPIEDGTDGEKGLFYSEYNLPGKERKATKSFSFGVSIGDFSISGTMSVSSSAKVDLTVERYVSWFVMSEGKMTLTTETSVEAELKYKNKLLEAGNKDALKKTLKTKDAKTSGGKKPGELVKVEFQGPAGFVGEVVIQLKFELSGAIKIQYTQKKTDTYSLKNGRVTIDKGDPTGSKSVSVEAKITFGVELAFNVKWGIAGVANVTFFTATVGLYAEGKGSTKFTYDLTGVTKAVMCVDLTYSLYFKIEFKFGLVKVEFIGIPIDFDIALSKDYRVYIIQDQKLHYDGYNVGTTLSGLLMSSLFQVKDCSLKSRTIRYVYGNGKEDKTVTYNVNEVINNTSSSKNPGTPTRSGYKFKGWYVDAAASGWTGKSDFEVVFGKTLMPYLRPSILGIIIPAKELVIYAKWQEYHPATGITLNKTSITSYSNNPTSVTLTPTVKPSNCTNKGVKWTSSNTNVATVDSNGNVKIKNAGTAIITCTSVEIPSVKATCNVTVRQSVTDINLNTTGISRYSDELGTVQLSATVAPGDAYDKGLTWTSSNTSVAAVSASGVVTLKGVGTAEIVCKSNSNPNVIAKCQVNVRQAVTDLTLDKTTLSGYSYAKQTVQLHATVQPTDVFNKALRWTSSNESVVTVSGDGVVTFKGVGTAIITCTSVNRPNVKATCSVTVQQSVEELVLNMDSVSRWSDDPNKTVQLSATILPNNAANKALNWTSSNTNVATVSANGIITLKNAGKAVIFCTSVSNPNVQVVFNVTIWRAVDSLTLDKTNVERTKDEPGNVKLNVTVSPANAENKSVTWVSSDNSVVSVSNEGIVTVNGTGTATVTATSLSTPSKTAQCTFVITPSVTGMELNKTGITRYSSVQDDIQLIETLEAVSVANREVIWTSSNAQVATVSSTGLVHITGVGDAVITCTSVSNPDVQATCEIHILQSVEQINLNMTSAGAYTGNNSGVQIVATVLPATAENKNLIWSSSDASVVSVSDNGLVTVIGKGDATITCTSVSDPHLSAQCSFIVKQGVTSIALDKSGINGKSSDSDPILITAKVQPANADNKEVTWTSSNTSVATVSNTGIVTIVGAGTATITCTSVSNPAITAQCSVEIRQAVETVSLDRTEITCLSDNTETVTLSATVLPLNATNRDIIWTSSNEDVASVTDAGVVTINGVGTATITCQSVTNPSAKATCAVQVNQAVYALTLNENTITRYSDDVDDIVLVAKLQPGIAYDKSVTWRSSDTAVAMVSQNGVVTIKGPGTAVIHCVSVSSPDVEDICRINIRRAMSSITLDQTALDLNTDDTEGVQLTATILPADADESRLIWTSSNADVAMVSDTGRVTPLSVGTAVIECASARNNTIHATCEVTVREHVQAIAIEGEAASLMPGETLQLTATCFPDSAYDKSVTWSTSDSSIANINASDLLTAISYGDVIVTATSNDSPDISENYAVRVEHELAIEAVVENDVVYQQGDDNCRLATVTASNSSAIRMARGDKELVWTLQSNTDDVTLETVDTTVESDGVTYETTYAVLYANGLSSTGNKSYTVICTAGSYTDQAAIAFEVRGGNYAESVAIVPATYFIDISEEALVPNVPESSDDKALPEGITLSSIAGDIYYSQHAAETRNTDGISVSFDESGMYTATVQYRVSNLTYDAPVTFKVSDENGVVHYKAQDVMLSQNSALLVEGETLQLECEVSPNETYDKSVLWSSSDESIVTVDQNGFVTAVSAGNAAVICEAQDGSGASDICAITVEAFVQLDESELEYTIYTGGLSHVDLGIVNVTIDSEKRISASQQNVTWKLEKLSGKACEIAVEEFRNTNEEGVTVSGNTIKLIRINEPGTDTYRLTCCVGETSDSCVIRVNVIEKALPTSIALNQSAVTMTVEEFATLNTQYTTTPAGTSLPEDVSITVTGGRAFLDALSDEYSYLYPEKLIFTKGGTYHANVVFKGDNFSYSCPITVTVTDEDGNVPENVTAVTLSEETLYMTVGDSKTLTASVEPANVPHSTYEWNSSNTSVATVSSTGVVTAIGEGFAIIGASVNEYDYAGACFVVVENGLTLASNDIERTIFLDGVTRCRLDTVVLTTASSMRLGDEAPVWQLSRVSGNNLTLRASDYTAYDADGSTIYGCCIDLYSVSRTGDTLYELSCTAGGETVSLNITVHVLLCESNLPASMDLEQKVFTGRVNELIKIEEQPVAKPEGTLLPDGMRVEISGNAVFNDALNTEDYLMSQSLNTLSFSRAGLYEANIIYSYSNMRYVIPITFRIQDENGNVPILSTQIALSDKSLWLTQGETASISAVFTPAEANDQVVTWLSSNSAVATVDSNGNVRAVGKGKATISCDPHDPYLPTVTCSVVVEDYLSVECGSDNVSLYKQGDQVNELPGASLSVGTVIRLREEGITPEWELIKLSGANAEIKYTISDNHDAITVLSNSLISGGTDVYRIKCTAGSSVWTHDFTLNVLNLTNAPTSIMPADSLVNLMVGQTATIDFTPVCTPSGTVLPEDNLMWDVYAGIGDEFYEAVDHDVYDADGDTATVAFTKPGRYMLTRYFMINNLHYSAVCEIIVGNTADAYQFIRADSINETIYLGGKSGVVTSFTLIDPVLRDVFEGEIVWTAERLSGDSLNAAIRENEKGAELFVANAQKEGVDVWRVSAAFGSFISFVDVTISVEQPRSTIPESISLTVDTIQGMIGDWLSLPIGAVCAPAGSALPETGDSFWNFVPKGNAEDTLEWTIIDGILKVRFTRPGYYTGTLKYRAGNFSYAAPVYFAITDEEGVINEPNLHLYLLDMADTVYTAGESGINIGVAMIGAGLADYYSGIAGSYMHLHGGVWSIETLSGNAARISIKANGVSSADVVLDSISASGTVTFEVRCEIDDMAYRTTGSITIINDTDLMPDPTLGSGVFYAVVREPFSIPTTVYDRKTGSILQCTTEWDVSQILAQIGYEYETKGDEWEVTFYEEGTYTTCVDTRVGNALYHLPVTIVVRGEGEPEPVQTVFRLPAALLQINEKSFKGSSAQIIDLRGTRVTVIGKEAFANCIDLVKIYIPAGVTTIADDAFHGCLHLTIVCVQGSVADVFAAQHGIPVQYE